MGNSNLKYSNCLVETLKEYFKNPLGIIIYKKKGEFPHCFDHYYWYSVKKDNFYHFSASRDDLSLLQQLWFKGEVKEYRFPF